MADRRRVLVIGTTSDYVEIIRTRYPGRALFLTSPGERGRALEPSPGPEEEALHDLGDEAGCVAALRDHCARHSLEPTGVACYDCESLLLASAAASAFGLPFASGEAIRASRDKFVSKERWSRAGVPCPRAAIARDASEARAAAGAVGLPCIVKPLSGSGSELVFKCDTVEEALTAYRTAADALARHGDPRMYPPERGCGPAGARDAVLFESFEEGPEFSCDYLLEGKTARAVRFGGKIVSRRFECGIARAYFVPANRDMGMDPDEVLDVLARAARALGYERGLFMADFIMGTQGMRVIEIAPRASGDCLPWLTRRASGLDTIGLALDVAENLPVALPPLERWKRMAGLRLFARRAGTIRRLDGSRLAADPRVEEVHFYRRPGHVVRLPPEDYHSRVLGHALFRPDPAQSLEAQCDALEGLFEPEWEPDTRETRP